MELVLNAKCIIRVNILVKIPNLMCLISTNVPGAVGCKEKKMKREKKEPENVVREKKTRRIHQIFI